MSGLGSTGPPPALGGNGRHGDLKFQEGGKPAVKRHRSKRRRCDWCDSRHRSCVATDNPEDENAPCDHCMKHDRVCTYDRSQYQALVQAGRERALERRKRASAAKAAEQGRALKIEEPFPNNSSQYLSNYRKPEESTPSLPSDHLDLSWNGSTQDYQFPTNPYLVGSLSSGYFPSYPATPNNLQTNAFPMTAMISPSAGSATSGVEPPHGPGQISQEPLPDHITYDIPSDFQYDPPGKTHPIVYSQYIIPPNPFEGVPGLHTPTSFPHIDLTLLQDRFGPQADQLNEEKAETEDLISLALRAIQKAREAGYGLGEDRAYSGEGDETFHK